MSEISFGSTYRIKITQAGISPSKKQKLRELAEDYKGLIGKGTDGYARVSILNKEDDVFIQKLKGLGYKIFQRFKGEKVGAKDMDTYIQRCLNNREFEQFGGQKNKLSKAYKEKIKLKKDLSVTVDTLKRNKPIENNTKIEQAAKVEKIEKVVEQKPAKIVENTSKQLEEARIRTTPDYIRIKNEHGEEAAEFVFFGKK